ncbi:hypothetical protein MATL_G00146170 [Megalops atlanticus]|uniref:Uncharacterized protein n=1 Tax=Megalops atlanticus TaxID=7932 RepID=A0A9D3PTL1_MEGAT|nr:hypothetical protein MATL_G00146170 [Megalops atlanticus]
MKTADVVAMGVSVGLGVCLDEYDCLLEDLPMLFPQNILSVSRLNEKAAKRPREAAETAQKHRVGNSGGNR